jgi:hypothetical protein
MRRFARELNFIVANVKGCSLGPKCGLYLNKIFSSIRAEGFDVITRAIALFLRRPFGLPPVPKTPS